MQCTIEHIGFANTFNTLKPSQNFADNIFKNISITLKISPKFVPKVPIYNIPALVQEMAWRRPIKLD